MAFDDLARHMAARDGKKARTDQSADQILAEGLVVQQRMNRSRNLILGGLLLFGGLALLTIYAIYLYGVVNPSPTKPPERSFMTWTGGAVFAGAMVITGAIQVFRGLRGRTA